MRFIGRFGEYTVLTRLLEADIEAYPAVKVNQDSYDITAVSKGGRVIRIEVKTTDLFNDSTNNLIGKLARTFDFLAVVIVEGDKVNCYVLTHAQAIALKGDSVQLGVSRRVEGKFEVKPALLPYRERWDHIRNFEPAHPLAAEEPARP